MKKKITIFCMLIFSLSSSWELSAQSSDVLLISGSKKTSSSGMIIHIDEKGKMHKYGGDKIDIVELSINLNAEKSEFTFDITGKQKEGRETYFQCDNGKYVYVENEIAYPTLEDIDLLNYKTLQEAIDAFKKIKSEENAWAVWVLHTAKGD